MTDDGLVDPPAVAQRLFVGLADNERYTSLMRAVKSEHLEVVEVPLKHGSSILQQRMLEPTPLIKPSCKVGSISCEHIARNNIASEMPILEIGIYNKQLLGKVILRW
ncbi:hypothetical protein DPSP01_008143 [Paraphaeosphaeria sporulosa]